MFRNPDGCQTVQPSTSPVVAAVTDQVNSNQADACSSVSVEMLGQNVSQLSSSQSQLLASLGSYDHLPPQKLNKGKTLYFQPAWKQTFPWISTPLDVKGVICETCSSAFKLNLVPAGVVDKRAEDSFVSAGFCSWNKARERFMKHEASHCHQFAALQLSLYQSGTTINGMLSDKCAQNQLRARTALLAVITSIQYLARQGMAIRGHDNNEGNFVQLLNLRSKDIEALNSWLSDSHCRKFTCWEIQNEILELLAHGVLRNICEDIQSAKHFSIIVDGTTDISHNEQESIVLRYVTPNLKPQEMFVGFYSVTATDGNSLATMILDALLRLNLPLSNLRGQAYDGGSNMAGRLNGVQAVISGKQPLALFVHCLMHAGNLVAADCIEASPLVRDAVNLVNDLGTFFHQSTKLTSALRSVQFASTKPLDHVKPLCPTRVLCRGPALKAVVDNVDAIISALEEYAKGSSGEPASKACGFVTRLSDGNFIVSVQIALHVLTVLENLNAAVQCRSSNLSGMIEAMKMSSSCMQSMRSEADFTKLFQDSCKICDDFDLTPPHLPRQRRPPTRYTGAANPAQWSCAEDFFRCQYYAVVDAAVNGLVTRYDQPGILKYMQLERVLYQSCTFEDLSATVKGYPELSVDRLFIQLAMVHQQEWKCSSVEQYADRIRAMHPAARCLFGEVEAFVKLLMTIPCSNAEAERSFSCLRRVKSYLRNTMGQERLNHVAILAVHHERLDSVNVTAIAKDFIGKNDYRLRVFGHLTC
jgi:hypothetical protein